MTVRTILLTASLVSAVIATALAFRIYQHPVASVVELNRITLGWLAWSVALFVASLFTRRPPT